MAVQYCVGGSCLTFKQFQQNKIIGCKSTAFKDEYKGKAFLSNCSKEWKSLTLSKTAKLKEMSVAQKVRNANHLQFKDLCKSMDGQFSQDSSNVINAHENTLKCDFGSVKMIELEGFDELAVKIKSERGTFGKTLLKSEMSRKATSPFAISLKNVEITNALFGFSSGQKGILFEGLGRGIRYSFSVDDKKSVKSAASNQNIHIY